MTEVENDTLHRTPILPHATFKKEEITQVNMTVNFLKINFGLLILKTQIFRPPASLTSPSCCSASDGRDAEAMDSAGGRGAVCAGVSWNTGRRLPTQT